MTKKNPGTNMTKKSFSPVFLLVMFSAILFLPAFILSAKTTDAPAYMKPKVYVVKEGDILYEIAARKDIYGDKRLWPIIYYANRDILYDYKLLVEGQKLIIPSSVSGAEKDEAIQKALDMNWPSPGTKDTGAVSSKGLDKAKVNSAYSLELNAASSAALAPQKIEPTIKTVTVVKEITVTIPEENSGELDYMTAAVIFLLILVIGLVVFYFVDEAYRQKRRFLKLKKKMEKLVKENNLQIPGNDAGRDGQ
jgi:LysM repeat protein